MPTEIRMKRIQDQVKRVLTEILENKINDPRLEGAYITDVTVDRELDYANVYISAIGGQDRSADILDGLEKANGFIRYALGQEIKLRVLPKLRFFWDDTPDRVDRIESLLDEIRREREARGDVEEASPGQADEEIDSE